MKTYRIDSIDVRKHSVLRLTFDDGLVGELDLATELERGPLFAPLRDEQFFRMVSLAEDGRSFGWRLDQPGHEIDFGADAARADVETALVRKRAEHFRMQLSHAAK